MGMFGKRCWSNPTEPAAKAPNPLCFVIEYLRQVGPHVVARIRYPDCDNYEGLKIILYRDVTVKMIKDQLQLDPHFGKVGLSPFARFKPTPSGWDAAIALARLI